ncbi:MAG: xanthine dehydrogenase family protein subunit M [Deltaproteobacteria bacterium]|nr:xanthine dehydrogenase family protein subunit M [Deltaproteobacteria bacterium]
MLGSLPPFDYHQPSTIEEAFDLMRRLDGNVSLYAGGTEVLVALKEGKLKPQALIDIKRIPELGGIQADNGTLRLGAAVSTRAISRSPVVRERFPLLSEALKILGSMQIGNRATLGGNLANASPAADSAPPLLTLQASLRLVSPKGERSVALEDFFLAPGKTVLDQEILTEVRIPSAPAQGRGVFYKLGPRGAPEDICIVSVAVFVTADAQRKSWQDVRIALGAVAPTPVRARHAEAALQGQPIGDKTAKEAARLAAEKDANPITDIRGSASYRGAMVQVLVERAVDRLARDLRESAR